MARKFPIRHPSKPGVGKLPRRTLKSGSTTPRRTGKGARGMGLGYHGKPRGATRPAKGMGYHGKPPSRIKRSRRTTTHAGSTTPVSAKRKRK